MVDNADDAGILFGFKETRGIVDYLPYIEGVILFTTHTRGSRLAITHSHVTELGPMSRQDAGDFLERSLIREDLLYNSASIKTLLYKPVRVYLTEFAL